MSWRLPMTGECRTAVLLITAVGAGCATTALERVEPIPAATSGQPAVAVAATPAPVVAKAASVPTPWRSFHDVPPTAPSELVGRDLYLCCDLAFDGDREASDAGYLFSDDDERNVLGVGTPVRIVVADAHIVQFTANGRPEVFTLSLEYGVPKISGMQFFPLVLRETDPRPQVATFPPDVQAGIRDGRLVYGMTREQAAMARGFPPFHQTPDLDAPTWLLYDNGDVGQYVTFTDGRISSITNGPPP